MTTPHEQQAAMEAVMERFRDPQAAQITIRARAELGGGMRTDVDMRRHRIVVDEPRSVGGGDEGPNPVELALASLASCQAISYRVWAIKLGVALERVEVQADGDIDLRGFYGVDDSVRAGFSQVRLGVALHGPEPRESYERLAEAVDAHCPVLDLTGSAVPVTRTLVWD